MDVTPLLGRTAAARDSAPGAAAPAMNAEQADAVAREFEAMVVGQMMESMFSGLDGDHIFGGGDAEKPWRSFMLQEYGKAIADSGSLGIGDLVREEVARLYAMQQEETP